MSWPPTSWTCGYTVAKLNETTHVLYHGPGET